MYIVAVAWLYVTLMMAVAEASASNGSVLGAVITFVLYGLLPLSVLLYIMDTPGRRRAIKERERAGLAAAPLGSPAGSSGAPDTDDKAAADTVATVRKET